MGSEKLLPFHYDHSFGSEKSSQHEATLAAFGFPGGGEDCLKRMAVVFMIESEVSFLSR